MFKLLESIDLQVDEKVPRESAAVDRHRCRLLDDVEKMPWELATMDKYHCTVVVL